eukprot:1878795-Pyramimonas_sp.AAC.1
MIDLRHDQVHAHGIEDAARRALPPVPGDEGDEHSGRVYVRHGNPARHRVGGQRHSRRTMEGTLYRVIISAHLGQTNSRSEKAARKRHCIPQP